VIAINLLPSEYRKSEATPIARFLAIVIGAVVVTTALVVYGYVHYSQLRSIQEVREAAEAEYLNKKQIADQSLSLQAEINAYEARRKAITEVARNRILHSKKLDEFLSIVWNGDDKSAYYVWLNGLAVKPPREARAKGQATTGGTFSFTGYSDTVNFSRVTNLRDSLKGKKAFYDDFKAISRPGFKAHYWDDGLEPSSAGKFGFDLTFKPLGWAYEDKAAANKKTNK
jgi:Tfp pilus assembly protein PilN